MTKTWKNNTVKSLFEQVTPSTAEDRKFKQNWIEQFPFIKFDEAMGVIICFKYIQKLATSSCLFLKVTYESSIVGSLNILRDCLRS